ncbi:MAG: PEP-CTERM sorting domain-containing protein [Opitutales bacterium]
MPVFSENFESTGVADDAFTNDWDGPNGTPFSLTSGSGHLLNPAGTGNAWLNPVPSALGEIFAALHSGGTAEANTGQTFTAGLEYTLTFTQFRRDDWSGNPVEASIGDSDGPLASVDFPAVTATDTFITRTVDYTATIEDAGRDIFLRFVDSDGGTSLNQVAMDNIELTAVPEPASGTTALIGLSGLIALAMRRRGKQKGSGFSFCD